MARWNRQRSNANQFAAVLSLLRIHRLFFGVGHDCARGISPALVEGYILTKNKFCIGKRPHDKNN